MTRGEAWPIDEKEAERLLFQLLQSSGNSCRGELINIFTALDDNRVVAFGHIEIREVRKKLRHLLSCFNLEVVSTTNVGTRNVPTSVRKPSDCPSLLLPIIQSMLEKFHPVVNRERVEGKLMKKMSGVQEFNVLTLESLREVLDVSPTFEAEVEGVSVDSSERPKSLMEMSKEGDFKDAKANYEQYMKSRALNIEPWGKTRRQQERMQMAVQKQGNFGTQQDDNHWMRFDRDQLFEQVNSRTPSEINLEDISLAKRFSRSES